MTDVRLAKHAAESGHWYDKHGNLIEGVPNKSKPGEMRSPTLRDARKPEHQWCRGITSIISNCYRRDLELWKIREGIKTALRVDRENLEQLRGIVESLPHREDPEYVAAILEESQQVSYELADEGSRIHAAMQVAMQGDEFDPAYKQHVEGAVSTLDSEIGPRPWRSEVAAVSRYGYATKIDLPCDDWIVDVKSKDGDLEALQKMRPFESYAMQLAAGDEADRFSALRPNETAKPRRGGILYVSRTNPGVAVFKEVPEADLLRAGHMFRALLAYTIEKDRYKPDWAVSL